MLLFTSDTLHFLACNLSAVTTVELYFLNHCGIQN
ncbi:hypothetical protein BVRB_6g152800 [Beta vulgaris subsp. vulgaris]|nr:hypothetical protein BVRB_6g152800 [Beta vulgaris subsp. vulgaris]